MAKAKSKSKKNAKAGRGQASKVNSSNKNTNEKVTIKKETKLMKGFVPYLIVFLGLIVGLCLIIAMLGIDDGAGIVGLAIKWTLAGFLGFGALFLPLVMIYIGVKWIMFGVKWKFADSTDPDLRKEHRRTKMQCYMAFFLMIIITIAFGVFHESYDAGGIADMWSMGADDLQGGGIIGGGISFLMVLAFKELITYIILGILALLFFILMIGLTPDRIILRMQYNRALKQERIAEERAAQLEEEKEQREKLTKHENMMKLTAIEREEEKRAEEKPVSVPPSVRERQKAPKMSVDEILGFEEESETPDNVPLEAEVENNIYIGPSPEFEKNMKKTPAEGVDYADDAPFDTDEYEQLNNVMNNVKSGKTAGKINIDAETENIGEIEDFTLGEISEDELHSDIALVTPDEQDIIVEEPETPYSFPPIDLLSPNKNPITADHSEELQENAKKLMETLRSFKVGVREITYSRGPTITRYELKPEVGTRVKSIANLVDDISLSLATSGVRIEAPIPNKPAVGIEVPNRIPATVYLRDLIESPRFADAKSYLTSCLGMDVGGNPIYFDISKMPHLLIAGATGMGKSVCINSVIISLLYKARPDQLKLILIDPKKVEFNIYKDIPHLYCPIVSDPKKAAGALASAVAEMERRFNLIEEVGVRDITTYNKVTEDDPAKEHLTHMVIIIDELADLMMTAADEVETSICRLAQKARAAGIHIIIGTQRPSVDVITGLIKSNIPSRIACTVASQIDSRTIIDMAGAEKLIGRGDMLFAPVGSAKPLRVQGSYVSEAEVEQIVSFIKETNSPARYNSDFIQKIEEEAAKCGLAKKDLAKLELEGKGSSDEGGDEKFREAVLLAIEENKIATSLLQRRLGIGYGRAAKIIDTMEQYGYVSKADGNKPRRVLISMDEYMRRISDGDLGGEG